MSVEWAAGLFEGEGSVTVSGGTRRLQLKMTEEESVRRFHVIMGRGTVYGPYRHKAKDGYPRRPIYMWVARHDDADDAVSLLYPHVSEWRREAMRRIFPDIIRERIAA